MQFCNGSVKQVIVCCSNVHACQGGSLRLGCGLLPIQGEITACALTSLLLNCNLPTYVDGYLKMCYCWHGMAQTTDTPVLSTLHPNDQSCMLEPAWQSLLTFETVLAVQCAVWVHCLPDGHHCQYRRQHRAKSINNSC